MASSTSPRAAIRVALAGIGNCASALVQGIEYYRAVPSDGFEGIMEPVIAGYRPSDIEIVCAFDIDRRKVGRPLEEAIFAPPNCVLRFQHEIPRTHVTVQMSPPDDGIAAHMHDYPEDRAFRCSDAVPVDLAEALVGSRAEVLVCYLPVGSEKAVQRYANACLQAGVALVNCVPVFIASSPEWSARFAAAGLPIIGDDIKSQFGATVIHRALARLFNERGCRLENTYQLNTGGNTDFLNMLALDRLVSKKRSKTQSVQSQLGHPLSPDHIHIGPSDYVHWQHDKKVAFIRLEGRGFGATPIELELRLAVHDSPNSAGVVIDAIRVAKYARKRGQAGPVELACAYYMKSPPRQLGDNEARSGLRAWLNEDSS